jgi:hypothetical protein
LWLCANQKALGVAAKYRVIVTSSAKKIAPNNLQLVQKITHKNTKNRTKKPGLTQRLCAEPCEPRGGGRAADSDTQTAVECERPRQHARCRPTRTNLEACGRE